MPVLALLSACINDHFYVNFNGKTLSHTGWRYVLLTVISSICRAVKNIGDYSPDTLSSCVMSPRTAEGRSTYLLSLLQHHRFSLAPCISSQSSKVRRKLHYGNSFMFRNTSQEVLSALLNPKLIITTFCFHCAYRCVYPCT